MSIRVKQRRQIYTMIIKFSIKIPILGQTPHTSILIPVSFENGGMKTEKRCHLPPLPLNRDERKKGGKMIYNLIRGILLAGQLKKKIEKSR